MINADIAVPLGKTLHHSVSFWRDLWK